MSIQDIPVVVTSSKTKVLTGPTFLPKIPEIYQLEAHSACQLKCDFCPRFVPEKERDDYALDVGLARTIAERDLGGSYFVEFQLSGEPLLHKKLDKVVEPFLGKVVTGLSTNGLLIYKHVDVLLELDYLTISVDSVTDYNNIRKGGDFTDLVENIELLLLAKKKHNKKLLIDLQVIELDNSMVKNNYLEQTVLLQKMVDERNWDVKVRNVQDCSSQLYNRAEVKADCKDLCLNPWLSVTVHSDGDVVPCCFAFGKEVVYGNLNEQSLEDIWANSPVRKELMRQHLTGDYVPMCQNCVARSPTQLHQTLYNDMFKRLRAQS
jgi:radical SAM protein with 4Fe4S-binding SPASM domain